ncbi:uncharacterized protein PHALS_01706 [Plasmopara halstedii]|uniref:Uncharacterized protein n=1 Tax=Plasmopara halstedii TaxID=4781 RepID=A0A0P1AT82_PLAHL|nr:uncharacterized protein PHALS_01706 [Plasmopara halstedii]CEG45407.1 hypothetical protein PHALS_01706 [Plasmopara halstedii]|eukprot:XP_024581776.1 hypothetical protein PHALS_01706 [Plasmopara halstedii]
MGPDNDGKTGTMPSGPFVGVMTNTIDATDNKVIINNSKILLSKNDRVQLAHTIKEMMMDSHEANPASVMTTENLIVLLTEIATTSSTLSHVAGIIDAARTGNTGALAGHLVDLLKTFPISPLEPVPPAVDTPASNNPK